MTTNSYCFVCHFTYLKDRFEKVFITDGFDNWKMFVAKFNKHQASSSHIHANSLWLNAHKNYQDNKTS
jgi:hypothetical protein